MSLRKGFKTLVSMAPKVIEDVTFKIQRLRTTDLQPKCLLQRRVCGWDAQ